MRPSQAVDDGTDDRVSRLLDWLYEKGGSVHASLRFVHSDEQGWSAVTTSALAADSQIVTVPQAACITTATARRRILALLSRSGEVEDIDAGEVDLSDHDWILLYLVLHKALLPTQGNGAKQTHELNGEGSTLKRKRSESDGIDIFMEHASYVALLPDEVLTPLHFRRAELQLLEHTPLYGHAARQREDGRASCIRAAGWLRRKLPSLHHDWARQLTKSLQLDSTAEKLAYAADGLESESGDCDGDAEHWSMLSVWRWAQSAHGSRAFPPRLLQVKSAPVLIPVLDLFNHARQSKVTWSYDDSNADNDTDARVTFTLHNEVPASRHVLNSYGPKSNEDLLACYGFVDDDMLDDTVTLKLGAGASRVISDDEERRRDTKQHYWRLNQGCPESLLAEVQAILVQQDMSQSGEQQDTQSDAARLMLRGEALEIIVDLLQKKHDVFMQSQAKLKHLLHPEETGPSSAPAAMLDHAHKTLPRPSVVHNVRVYREGQAQILRWALGQAQREEDDVARQIETLLGPVDD